MMGMRDQELDISKDRLQVYVDGSFIPVRSHAVNFMERFCHDTKQPGLMNKTRIENLKHVHRHLSASEAAAQPCRAVIRVTAKDLV